MKIWKAGLCLLLAFSFLSQPTYAVEETTTVEEVTVASGNPIMIIRCRFDESEGEDQFSSSSSKKADNSKIDTSCEECECPEGFVFDEDEEECVPDCGTGFKYDFDKGGCVPNCNSLRDDSNYYNFNFDTGECDCVEPGLKGSTSKDVSIACTSFCFYSELKDLDGDEGCQILVCPEEDSTPKIFSVFDEESKVCYSACFDGELNVEVPTLDCSTSNQFGHVAITVCFTSADPDNPLVPGQRVPFADIQNCFGDAGEPLLQAAIDANVGDEPEQGEEFYFDAEVDEFGKLCVDFFIDPLDPLVINFSNSATVTVPTCFTDPCACDNPNVTDAEGNVVLFYDELSNLTGLPAGGSVNLIANNNADGFTDNIGTQIPNGFLATVDGMGNFTYAFFRASGALADIQLEIRNADGDVVTTQTFTSDEACDAADCAAIPTMGQWGLLILALLLSSLGLVFMSRRRMA